MSVLCRLMCALLFVGWTAEWPLATDKLLYCGYWRSPFQFFGPLFVSVPGLGLFPWQIALLALAPLCLLRPGALRRRAPLLDGAIVLSFASLAVTFLWGVTRGGSAYNAYYQLWRFLVALLVGLLVLSVIRSSRDVKGLGTTVVLAALVRATLAMYFYWEVVRGRIDPIPPYMTTHDDTLLFVAGIVIVLSWALARERASAWMGAALATAYIVYAVILNDRRLAWIEILLALVLMYFVLPRGRVHRRVNRALLFAAPVLVVYVIVGWGRQGGIFEPVHALSTAGSNDDSSSLARQEEIRNLLYTLSVAGNPLLGTGWGMPYQKLTSVYANFGPEWWQYLYMPHNSLLAIAVFGGLVGLGGIWLVVPVAAFLAMRGYRGVTDPIGRAGAMAALCILPAYGAQCYGDLGFQSLTGGLVLGVALGVAGKMSAWAASPAPRPRPRLQPAPLGRH
jgi:uncharacterized membrane protein SirB2